VFGIISFYILVVYSLYAEQIVTIIYGSKYQPSIPVLRIAAIAIPCLFNIAAIIITVIDRQHINTRILGYATIANLVANVVCIHLWQASGAALATLITYLVIFILSHGYLMRIKIVKLRKTIINYIVTSLVSIAALALGLVGLGGMHYIISFLIISIFFFTMIALLLVRKDDIRILKETVGMK
jgi:O-antigen/teichoic acid export membrane protein